MKHYSFRLDEEMVEALKKKGIELAEWIRHSIESEVQQKRCKCCGQLYKKK